MTVPTVHSHETLSVVIPVFNGEHFVCDAIESVLAQREAGLEVIVVDNNSTDRTRAVVQDRYDSRVTVINEARPGAANARNTGARQATGSLLAFLDADDVWLPEKHARQCVQWDATPDAHLLFSWCEEFQSPEMDPAEKSQYVARDTPYALLTPSSLLLRRETFRTVGDFPDIPGGEFIAWFGLARSMGLRESIVGDILVRRRIHASNSTRGPACVAGYAAAAKWLLDRRRSMAASTP